MTDAAARLCPAAGPLMVATGVPILPVRGHAPAAQWEKFDAVIRG